MSKGKSKQKEAAEVQEDAEGEDEQAGPMPLGKLEVCLLASLQFVHSCEGKWN